MGEFEKQFATMYKAVGCAMVVVLGALITLILAASFYLFTH